MKLLEVRVITKKRIKQAIEKHSEWKASLETWHTITKTADWKNSPDVRQSWRNSDLVGICVVFDIANNRARLIAHVDGWKDDCNC